MCTSVAFPDQQILIKNLDVPYQKGMFMINKKGYLKRALMLPPYQPVEWTAIYDSLTVVQHSKEFSLGGMNEKGLIVEQLTLPGTIYEDSITKPSCQDLQWIQMMLDTCEDVGGVLQQNEMISIGQSNSRLHFVVMDRSGGVAVIEFLDGESRIHSESGTLTALFNHSWFLEPNLSSDEYAMNSVAREKVALAHLRGQDISGFELSDYLHVLHITKRDDTILSLVYDNANMEVSYQQQASKNVTFDLKSLFNVSENRTRAFDGEQWELYCKETNRRLADEFLNDPTLKAIFQWEIPEEIIDFLGDYPDSFQRTPLR